MCFPAAHAEHPPVVISSNPAGQKQAAIPVLPAGVMRPVGQLKHVRESDLYFPAAHMLQLPPCDNE